MRLTWIRAAIAVVAMTSVVACGDDDGGGGSDAGRSDGGRGDAGLDSGTVVEDDAGGDDDAGSDAAVDEDGGGSDAGDVDGGDDPDGGTEPTPTSEQIAAVRAADAGPVDLDVDEAVVTYLKPAVGDDAAGFFVQAEPDGPALFVRVDPATLTPSPEIGDVISFTVTEVAVAQGRKEATAITDLSLESTDFDVSTLVVDRSSATDLVSAIDSYEAELIRLSGTITGPFSSSGNGHEAAPIDTAGITGTTSLQLRMPIEMREALDARIDLEPGCDFTATAPMWRWSAGATVRAQLSVYFDPDDIVVTCPGPSVERATAASGTSVTVAFTRELDPASVMASGAQFTISDGVTVSAATVSGRTVTLTTSELMPDTMYTVTVADTITDLVGAGVEATGNTGTFTYTVTACGVVINEVSPGWSGSANEEFVEIHNTCATAVSLADHRLVYRSAAGSTDLVLVEMAAGFSIPANGYLWYASPMASFQAAADDRFRPGVQLSNSAGGVALRDGDGNIVDSMGYGSGVSNGFVEGTAATVSGANQAMSRIPNGTDTDDNSVDFAARAPTRGAANL